MQCTARSKQSGERCKKDAVGGFTVCHIHGGKTPVGIASPNFKTGAHSKHLPQNMFKTYQDMINNPDLLSVRSDVALIDAMIAAKLPLLESGESAQHWEQVTKFIRQARIAYKTENYGTLEDALNELEAISDKRRLFYATEQEVGNQLELRRKLVDTENKILYNKERALTAEQAMLMISALLDSVRRNVDDADVRGAIQADFIRVASLTNQQRISSGNNE